MTFINSIQSYFFSVPLKAKNLTFSQRITLIKNEIERSIMNILELRKQLNDLTPYLKKVAPEEMREAFKMLRQVKDKIQISGNDWKDFKDIERKFIQANLINWENIPEARGKINKASKQILEIFDYKPTALSFHLTSFVDLNLFFCQNPSNDSRNWKTLIFLLTNSHLCPSP